MHYARYAINDDPYLCFNLSTAPLVPGLSRAVVRVTHTRHLVHPHTYIRTCTHTAASRIYLHAIDPDLSLASILITCMHPIQAVRADEQSITFQHYISSTLRT